MSQAIHPLFAGILAGIQQQPAILERCSYETALRKHDWSHEFSDDGNVYRRGRAELAALREQQARIDRDWRIWNSIAPTQCANGRSYS